MEHEPTRPSLGHTHAWQFLGVFFLVFFLIAIFLYAIDFVPEPIGAASEEESAAALTDVQHTSVVAVADAAAQYPVEEPVRIVAASVGIDTPVVNPVSMDVNTLDNALLSGAARYPASALLGENARVYIFGHQSYLPVVHNHAFKAFNGLQNLSIGDEIIVYSETAAYHYRVSSVTHTTADAGTVELGSGARTLTLSTCDSFGSKNDRTVVTAEFAARTSLGS